MLFIVLGMLDGMMKQLISKEVLYSSLKELYDNYPSWLSKNKPNLPKEDYANYLKQFGYIEQIIAVYDAKGDDGLNDVLRLMREVPISPISPKFAIIRF